MRQKFSSEQDDINAGHIALYLFNLTIDWHAPENWFDKSTVIEAAVVHDVLLAWERASNSSGKQAKFVSLPSPIIFPPISVRSLFAGYVSLIWKLSSGFAWIIFIRFTERYLLDIFLKVASSLRTFTEIVLWVCFPSCFICVFVINLRSGVFLSKRKSGKSAERTSAWKKSAWLRVSSWYA